MNFALIKYRTRPFLTAQSGLKYRTKAKWTAKKGRFYRRRVILDESCQEAATESMPGGCLKTIDKLYAWILKSIAGTSQSSEIVSNAL
ncbi:MAG: hypothetical protein KGS72_21660 [Cyanobacteria bacterium REEB67]|nr:hypothetical protein [Cyanobacteria bacterium REEB67]